MKPIVAYYLLAVVLDWGSTIVQTPQGEENPVMRAFWLGGGGFVFSLVTVAVACLVVTLHAFLCGFRGGRYAKVADYTLFALSTFKLLIALTNLALIPYWVTGWYKF